MAEPVPRSRGALSRDRVLRAAVELADDAGIAALSMRRLGQVLGVEAMSLYNHVANKEDLLNAIVDLVVGEFELPAPDADWKPALRAAAISAHDLLVRHPWAATIMLTARESNPARWRWMDAVLGCLRGAGFSAELTDQAYHALDSHITGFTLWQVQVVTQPAELPGLAAAFLRQLPDGKFPYLVEHVHQHLRERAPGDPGAFEFGLDLILDGLERLRDAG